MEDYRDELSPGMKCVKYLVVAFNSIFVVSIVKNDVEFFENGNTFL